MPPTFGPFTCDNGKHRCSSCKDLLRSTMLRTHILDLPRPGQDDTSSSVGPLSFNAKWMEATGCTKLYPSASSRERNFQGSDFCQYLATCLRCAVATYLVRCPTTARVNFFVAVACLALNLSEQLQLSSWNCGGALRVDGPAEMHFSVLRRVVLLVLVRRARFYATRTPRTHLSNASRVA